MSRDRRRGYRYSVVSASFCPAEPSAPNAGVTIAGSCGKHSYGKILDGRADRANRLPTRNSNGT